MIFNLNPTFILSGVSLLSSFTFIGVRAKFFRGGGAEHNVPEYDVIM